MSMQIAAVLLTHTLDIQNMNVTKNLIIEEASLLVHI
jgi:hypothetical protein